MWNSVFEGACDGRSTRSFTPSVAPQHTTYHLSKHPHTHTLMSFLRFLLKQQYRILRCPGLRPSTMLGMERSRSARLNRISSW